MAELTDASAPGRPRLYKTIAGQGAGGTPLSRKMLDAKAPVAETEPTKTAPFERIAVNAVMEADVASAVIGGDIPREGINRGLGEEAANRESGASAGGRESVLRSFARRQASMPPMYPIRSAEAGRSSSGFTVPSSQQGAGGGEGSPAQEFGGDQPS